MILLHLFIYELEHINFELPLQRFSQWISWRINLWYIGNEWIYQLNFRDLDSQFLLNFWSSSEFISSLSIVEMVYSNFRISNSIIVSFFFFFFFFFFEWLIDWLNWSKKSSIKTFYFVSFYVNIIASISLSI